MSRKGLDATLKTGPLPRLSLLRRSPGFQAGVWSFADQGLVSLASFMLMVLLARRLPAEEFGGFVLVFMAIYLANNFQTSIISRPHNVVGANLEEDAFRQYTSRVFSLQVLMAGCFAVAGCIAALTARTFSGHLSLLLAAATLTLVAWQFQEFARQVQFTRGRPFEALRFDLVSYGSQAFLIGSLWLLHHLSAISAMLALAASLALSAVFAHRRIGILPGGSPFPVLRFNWRMGRWILGDNLGQWLSTLLFPFLVAIFAGPAATAAYRLLMNVVAPVHVVFTGLPSFAAPRASRAYHSGGMRGLLGFALPLAVLVGLPVMFFLGVAGLFGARILDLLYGEGYAQYAGLIWLFAVAYFAVFLFDIEYICLLALGKAQHVFLGRVVSIALTLTIGVGLTAAFGLTGALIGLVVSSVGLCAALGVILLHTARHERLSSKAVTTQPWPRVRIDVNELRREHL